MRKYLFGFLVLPISVLVFACKPDSPLSYRDIEGGWWFLDSDSTYSEFFIRNDSVWSFGEAGGIAFGRFQLERFRNE